MHLSDTCHWKLNHMHMNRKQQGDAARSGGTPPAVGVPFHCGPRFLSLGTFDTGAGDLCGTAIAKGPW